MAKLVFSNDFNRQILALTLISICVLATISLSSARYLPTRSDESRRERIKEVLRMLLDLPPEQSVDYGRSAYDYQSAGGAPITKRDVHSVNGLSRNTN